MQDPSHDWSRLLRDGGAVLLAWTHDDETRFRGTGRPFAASGMTIVRVPIGPEMVER